MRRKATKQSPAANAEEVRFQNWAKHEPCACCGAESGSILDHWQGSSKKLYSGPERVMVGHWLVLPLCVQCDEIKTRGSLRAFNDKFGDWLVMWVEFVSYRDIPKNVLSAVDQEINKAEMLG